MFPVGQGNWNTSRMSETQFTSSQLPVNGYPLNGFSEGCFNSPASFPFISLSLFNSYSNPHPDGICSEIEINLKDDLNKMIRKVNFLKPIYSGNTFLSHRNLFSELCEVGIFILFSLS